MVKKRNQLPELEVLDSSDEEANKFLGFHSFSSSKNKNHSTTTREYISQIKPKRKFTTVLNRKNSRYNKDI